MHRLRSSLVLQLLLGCCCAALVTGTPACDSPCDDPWSTPEPYAVDDLPTDRAVRGSGDHWIVGDGGLVAILEPAGATVLPPPVDTNLHAVVVTANVAVLVGAGGTILTGTVDGSEFLRATLASTADLWHVADINRADGNILVAVGDDVMFIRDALVGTWTAVTPPEGGWGRLRAVGQGGDEGLIAVGLGGVAWSAVQPAGPWRRLDLGTTADLTSFHGDFGPLIGGSDSTLLTYAPDSGWSPLAHDFAGDVLDLAPGFILTSTGDIYTYDDYNGFGSKPIATVGQGLNVLSVVGYGEQLLVLGEPGRAVSLDNACPALAGGFCEGRPFVMDEQPRTAAARPRSDWSSEPATASPALREPATASPALRDALAAAWTDAALAEHASIASFARAVLELMSLGAPPELLRDTQAALADEIEHAALCFAEARRHRDHQLGPGPLALDATALARVGDPIAIAIAVFDEGCVGEGVAAAIAGLASEECSDEATAALLRRISGDESRHAALAWRTLRWLLDQFGETVAAPLRVRLATLTSPAAPHRERRPLDLGAHGRLPVHDCRAIHRAVVRQVVRPLATALLHRAAGEFHA